MHRGYIKLWRRIQDSFLNNDSELFHLWINLLLLASHKDTEFIFNGKKTVIKGGQFITGRQSLSLLTGIQESKIYRLLHILENEQLIEQQKTNLYTIVSIVNYNQYQDNEQLIEQQMNNKRTTGEQPVSTIKHLEALRSTKKKLALSDDDFLKKLQEIYKHVNLKQELNKMDAWLLANHGRQKTRRFIVNWLNKIDRPLALVKKMEHKPPVYQEVSDEDRLKISAMIKDTMNALPKV